MAETLIGELIAAVDMVIVSGHRIRSDPGTHELYLAALCSVMKQIATDEPLLGERPVLIPIPHEDSVLLSDVMVETERLRAVLRECEEYFDQRADVADYSDETGHTPNEEMQRLTEIREVIGSEDAK